MRKRRSLAGAFGALYWKFLTQRRKGRKGRREEEGEEEGAEL